MRQLGVTEFGDIKLGSKPPAPVAPAKELTEGEIEEARMLASRQRLEIALASSGVRPTDEWIARWQGRGISLGRGMH